MQTVLRKSGIEVVDDMPWGTHFCHFYDTRDDLLDVLVPYFKAGLESNELCVWVISGLSEQEARNALQRAVPDFDRYLADRSIEIIREREWYFNAGHLDLDRVRSGWNDKLAGALASGYAGMRVTGDTFWLKKRDWRDFSAYEEELNRSMVNLSMNCLCTYPLGATAATEVLDVARTHQFAVARRKGNWEVVETPELKRVKAELQRLNQELEQRVVERTRELTARNEELKRALDEIDKLRQRLESMVDTLQQSFEQLRALGARLQTVREEERRRIAREIHDDLGQALTAIKLAVSSLVLALPEEYRPLRRAESIVKLIDEGIASVRRIATELRPAILDDLGLVAAVEWAAEEFEARTGTRCRLNLSADSLTIDRERATAIFRILQEALTNVTRHSGATQVDVRLAVGNDGLTLEVHDNGIGVEDERASAPQSLGVLGMQERAVLLGGEFTIRAAPDNGTIVKVRIPLSDSRRA
jgi:signal transduction histidine kinase